MEKNEGGVSKKARLLQVYKTTGVMPQLLAEQVELDIRVEPYYHAFVHMRSKKNIVFGSMGGAYHLELTPREILDWMELEHNDLGPFGVSVIYALDQEFVSFKNKPPKKKDKPQKRGR